MYVPADRVLAPSTLLAAGPPEPVVGASSPVWAGGATLAWQATPYAPVAFAAAVVAVAFAVTTWRSGRGPGTLALTTLALAAAWWSFLYGLELASATLAGKLLFGRLSYLGIVAVPVSWFGFALAYTGRGHHLTPATVGLLSAPAAFAAVFPWTSGSNDLFWAATSLASEGASVVLAVEYGPAFWLWSAYSYALVAVGTVVLLRSVPSDARLFRVQTVLLLVGVAAPWLANLVYLLRLGPGALDPTPLGFVVSALALGSGFRRYRLLAVHPAARVIARDELVERLPESVVVLNGEGLVVDLNRSARSVFGVDIDDAVGEPLDAIGPDLVAAIEGVDSESESESDTGTVEFTIGDPPRYYEVQVSSLRGEHGRAVGRLVTLRDVTERRRREHRLAVLNRVLRHDLGNDVVVIEGYANLLLEDPGNAEYAEILAEQAAEMHDLVRTVHDVERTLGSGGPTVSALDIVRVVDEQVEAARRAHPAASVETDLPAAERVRATDLVSSAVDNLIENAIEHNDTDTPHVRVSVDRVTEDGRPRVEVRVADDGPGIPDLDRKVLVGDDEGQLDDASGLGLWLVNWIVTESGGEVRYEPNEPRGAVVVLRLPPVESGGETGERRRVDLDVPHDRPSRRPSTGPRYADTASTG